MSVILSSGWPDQFDVRTDPFCRARIKPFIDAQLELLRKCDDARVARQRQNPDNIPPITYRFYEHALRVADDVAQFCSALGLPENVQENMRLAMMAHDIGKHTMPIEIWDMTEKPEDAVKRMRRAHTERGVALVRAAFTGEDHPFIDLMTDIIAHHHEHMDGSGYLGLGADSLSLPVRVACIVESYDGYTIPRAHFDGRDVAPGAVIEKMRNEPGKGASMYDMALFDVFAHMKAEGARA